MAGEIPTPQPTGDEESRLKGTLLKTTETSTPSDKENSSKLKGSLLEAKIPAKEVNGPHLKGTLLQRAGKNTGPTMPAKSEPTPDAEPEATAADTQRITATAVPQNTEKKSKETIVQKIENDVRTIGYNGIRPLQLKLLEATRIPSTESSSKLTFTDKEGRQWIIETEYIQQTPSRIYDAQIILFREDDPDTTYTLKSTYGNAKDGTLKHTMTTIDLSHKPKPYIFYYEMLQQAQFITGQNGQPELVEPQSLIRELKQKAGTQDITRQINSTLDAIRWLGAITGLLEEAMESETLQPKSTTLPLPKL